MKKILALAMAALMTAGMTTVAFAANEPAVYLIPGGANWMFVDADDDGQFGGSGDVNRAAVFNGAQHFDAADFFGGGGQRVFVQNDEVGAFARPNRAFALLFADLKGGRQGHRCDSVCAG